MKDLGTKSSMVPEVAKASQKVVIRYPTVTLTSKQFPSLKAIGLKKGLKCTLEFTGDVDGFQSVSDYEIREQGLRKDDISVTFELMRGDISISAAKSGPKSIESARRELNEESKED